MAQNKGLILVGAGLLILLALTCFLIVENDDEVIKIIDDVLYLNSEDEDITGTVTVILPTGESKIMENFNPNEEGLLSVRTTKIYPNLIVKINGNVVEMPYFQNVTPNNYDVTATALGYYNFHQNVKVDAGIQIEDVIIKMDKIVVEETDATQITNSTSD